MTPEEKAKERQTIEATVRSAQRAHEAFIARGGDGLHAVIACALCGVAITVTDLEAIGAYMHGDERGMDAIVADHHCPK